MPEPEVVRVMREHRAALLRQEQAQMREMAQRWLQVEQRLAQDINDVLAEIRRRQAAGEVFGADQGPYVRLRHYRQLLSQVQGQIGGYSRWVEQALTEREADLVRLAVEQSQLAIEAVQAGAGIRAGFSRLLPSAVENMVANVSGGAPLRELLNQAWPDAATRMTQALVNGTALGWNPRKTARSMREGLQQGALQRCLTIARTEQLRVYRQASLETYRASGVVRGYKRLAAKQVRTCISCLVADGRFYALDEEFDEHPNGRCTLVPVVMGVDEPTWESGLAWLERQPEAAQKQVMGLARWDLWKNGRVSLGEMVERHEHPVWGGSLGVRPVSLLPGGPEALQKVYAAAAAKATAVKLEGKWKPARADAQRVGSLSREVQKVLGKTSVREVYAVQETVRHYQLRHGHEFDVAKAERLLSGVLERPLYVVGGKKSNSVTFVGEFDDEHYLMVPVKVLVNEMWQETLYIRNKARFERSLGNKTVLYRGKK